MRWLGFVFVFVRQEGGKYILAGEPRAQQRVNDLMEAGVRIRAPRGLKINMRKASGRVVSRAR
jgi:hypothetical protein